jgi:hypothetical protein
MTNNRGNGIRTTKNKGITAAIERTRRSHRAYEGGGPVIKQLRNKRKQNIEVQKFEVIKTRGIERQMVTVMVRIS